MIVMERPGPVLLALIFMTLVSFVEAQEQRIAWTRATDIPLPRGGYFAAWYNDGLWLAGGSYWKDGKKLWTNEASLYDPKTNAWSSVKPIPKAIGYGATASIGKEIYLFGGTDEAGNLNKDVYRLRNGEWDKIGESPTGFIYPAYATVGKKVYIFGGSASPGDVTTATNDVWVYDTKTNKFERGAPFPGAPRQTFSAAAIGRDIYMLGGVTQRTGEKFHNLDDAYRLDTKTGKWSEIRKMPIAMRAFWAGTDGESIYLIGGYAEGGVDTIYRYSTKTDSYELVSRLPQPLMDTKFIYNKGKFYGASGEDKLVSRFPGLVIGTLTD